MRKTKEEAALTRESLIEAARRVIHRKGYAATTLVDIAAEAELSRGAVYWHFSSKQEILSLLLERFLDNIAAIVSAAMISPSSPLERLRTALSELFAFLAGSLENRMLEEIILFKTELSAELEPLAESLRQRLKQAQIEAAATIAAGQACGQIRSDLSPELAASALVSFVVGAKFTWLLGMGELGSNASELVDFYLKSLEA